MTYDVKNQSKRSIRNSSINIDNDNEFYYDVCIVGAGPGALACLSAINEQYSIDHMTDEQITRALKHLKQNKRMKKNVVVIDPNLTWMKGWENQFHELSIKVLRSPALAHPDTFDQNALLAFAEKRGRTNELIESGCFDIKELIPLGQTAIGLWKLPTLKLFLDFCHDLIRSLKHTYICDAVVDIDQPEGKNTPFNVCLASGKMIKAKNVILAMGFVGKPNIPVGLSNVPDDRMIPWKMINKSIKSRKNWKKVLVIGGGLSAVQASQKLIAYNSGIHATVCSRRPLSSRHFDLHVEWFNWRTRNKCMNDFYHQKPIDRLKIIKESRNGGSVPVMYMKDVLQLEQNDKLHRLVGNAHFIGESPSTKQLCIDINGSVEHYDAVVLACGIQPDCTSNTLTAKILAKWPIPVVGGFPCINEDAQWTDGLYVIGVLASISIGPDAANLMGMRRAAEIIANAMECRCWLRTKALSNPFESLFNDDDSDDDIDTESQSDDEG